MKTQKLFVILFAALQLTGCASVSKSDTSSAHVTTLCVQAPCIANESGGTFLNALVTGFGAGLGWGAATAMTRSW